MRLGQRGRSGGKGVQQNSGRKSSKSFILNDDHPCRQTAQSPRCNLCNLPGKILRTTGQSEAILENEHSSICNTVCTAHISCFAPALSDLSPQRVPIHAGPFTEGTRSWVAHTMVIAATHTVLYTTKKDRERRANPCAWKVVFRNDHYFCWHKSFTLCFLHLLRLKSRLNPMSVKESSSHLRILRGCQIKFIDYVYLWHLPHHGTKKRACRPLFASH